MDHVQPGRRRETFAPDPAVLGEERFPERLETRAGWNHPSCDDDWFRGFSQELNDFVAAIGAGRQPLSGIQLAVDCVDVIYGAYVSAEEGRRVTLGGDDVCEERGSERNGAARRGNSAPGSPWRDRSSSKSAPLEARVAAPRL